MSDSGKWIRPGSSTEPVGKGLRRRRAQPLFVAAVLLLAVACEQRGPTAPPTTAPPAAAVTGAGAGIVPGRLLVRFAPGADRAGIARAAGAEIQHEVIPGIWLAAVNAGREQAAAALLAHNPNVVFAEPDHLRVLVVEPCTTCVKPDDPLFEWQWNMHNDGDVDFGFAIPTGKVGADIDWLEAYNQLGPTPTGTAHIGILDTGVRATHEDICGKVELQHNFLTGTDNADDDYGHGTHVAAIAGACANNGKGVVGVAYGPNMKFMVGKVCDANGECPSSAIAAGLVWLADHGANVVNMSFGDPAVSQTEYQGLQYAAAHGVLPFCAAGNEATNQILYPAAHPECVAVVATDWGDNLASYSSYGPQAELAAPGGDVQDPFFGTSYITSAWNGFDGDYAGAAGTSMATPHAAGLAALLFATGMTNPDEVRTRLRTTTDDLGAAGWDQYFGWGRINMFRAINDITNPGGGNAPPTASFTFSCTDLDCSFDASASADPDGSITQYDWDFGDGATDSGVTPSHTYAADGDYTVTLTVTDDASATGQSSQVVSVMSTVPNQPPLASFIATCTYLSCTFDASGSTDDGSIVDYSWDFGDGSSGNGVSTSHGYAADGTYTVVLTVTDDVGANGTANQEVTVSAAPNNSPTASFTDRCRGATCRFNDRSSDSDGSIVSWSWNFGDGESSTAQSPTHTYTGEGQFIVQLTVTDDQGAPGSSTTTINCAVGKGKKASLKCN